MGERRLRRWAIVFGIAVALVLIVGGSGVLTERATLILDNLSQFAAGLVATVACAWAASRSAGYERLWRGLMAVGMAGWSCGQAIWSWYQIFRDVAFPSPTLADIGYFMLPVFALVALLVIAARGGRRRGDPWPGSGIIVPSWVLLILDGLIVVGSMLVLTLSTTLGAVISAGAPNVLAFAVAIGYPLSDLLLVVTVLFMLAMQPLAQRLRPQLVLLGLGLVALSISDSLFSYLFTQGAESTPPLANAGFVLGPLLIAFAAALTPEAVGRRDRAEQRGISWTHLLLPYIPLVVTGCFIVVQEIDGQHEAEHAIEIYVGIPVVALVVVRQLLTLIDNTALLDRVSQAQERLQFQAYHDPVTNLANRTLFRMRLAEAVSAGRARKHPVALYFLDLDDFKSINDQLGHASGDRVLQAVADRLRGCVRSSDLVARLGGDEFGVLAQGDVADPAELGRRIQVALGEPFVIDEKRTALHASVGVVLADGDDPDVTTDQLLQHADDAMYAGKRRGKDTLVVYTPDLNDS